MERTIHTVTSPIPSIPKKIRVAAYTRVSSGKDTMLHSLSAQISYYSDAIQQHNDWTYAGVFSDEAMTGTNDSRDAFQRLLADCRAGKIDMILTKSISRFARNTITLLETVRELKEYHVDVYFERENIHSISGDGELLLTILASFAQEESLSVSENCKWRIRKNFKEARANTLRLYGYDFVHYRLVVNPAEAEVVRGIYADYLDGMGKNAIMRKLTAMGAPTKDGGRWSESTVDRILRNEKYVGNLLLQKTYSKNHLTKEIRVNHGELPMYYVEHAHEAIIAQSVFDAVQTEIARRRKCYVSQAKASNKSAFTGKIHCGICGANFYRKTDKAGTKGEKPIWICKTVKVSGKAYCGAKKVPESILMENAAAVLGLAVYDSAIFTEKIREIRVSDSSTLVFVFQDGHEITRTWQNKSRRDSWTPAMREQARKAAYSRERGDIPCKPSR
ncbi:MAG: recombinase family protein [Ruthenibacterium sp.]